MSPTEQARGDSGKERKLRRWQNGEKTLGETRLSRGASSPPARQISSLFQLQQSQSVSGPLVPGVFPRWMSRWRGPHWRSVSGAHLGGPRRGCHRHRDSEGPFSASALFSERLRGAARWVKTDIIASLSLHAITAEITAHELSVSCLILCIIWFHQTMAQYIYKWGFLEGRAGYVFLKGCFSVTISCLSRWLTKIILSKIYKY